MHLHVDNQKQAVAFAFAFALLTTQHCIHDASKTAPYIVRTRTSHCVLLSVLLVGIGGPFLLASKLKAGVREQVLVDSPSSKR